MAIPKKTAEIPSCAKIAPKEDTIWSNAMKMKIEGNVPIVVKNTKLVIKTVYSSELTSIS